MKWHYNIKSFVCNVYIIISYFRLLLVLLWRALYLIFLTTYPDDAVWSISGHEFLRLQKAIGFLGWDICLNDPVRLGPDDLTQLPPLPWGVTIRGIPLTLPVLAERLDVAVDAATTAAGASSPSGPDSLDSENRFGLKFKFATLLVTIWWRDEKKLILFDFVRITSFWKKEMHSWYIYIYNNNCCNLVK